MVSLRKHITYLIASWLLVVAAGQSALAALAVTSVHNKSVFEFTAAHSGTLRGTGTGFPSGVTYQGNDIVFSDTFAGPGNLKRIDPSNNVTFVTSYPSAVTPVGLASDAMGNLYSTDYLTGRVLVTNPFNVTTVFANVADGLRRPTGIDVDSAGNVYVADPRTNQIIKFDTNGIPIVFASGIDGLVTPLDVAVDSMGNVFVADFGLNGGTVWKFGPGGGPGQVFADSTDGISGPTGLTVNRQNNDVYVANYLVNTIVQLNPLGNATLYADSSDGLDGPVQLDYAAAVVPEPASLALWTTLTLVGVVWYRRQNRKPRA